MMMVKRLYTQLPAEHNIQTGIGNLEVSGAKGARPLRFQRVLQLLRVVRCLMQLRLILEAVRSSPEFYILVSYIDIAPENIRFAEKDFGKLYISADGKELDVKFNLSHSGDKSRWQSGLLDRIGVDIEEWNERTDCGWVVNRCFAEAECNFWNGLPASSKDEFFYRLWTRKESFVKAVGVSLGLDVSKVVSTPAGVARFLSVPEGYGPAGDWALVDLDVGRGISAALTVPAKCFAGFELRRLEPR